MKDKINIAELLKDCPKGMELDCTIYDNATFCCILEDKCYPIKIQTPEGHMLLSKYGCMSPSTHTKCVIFPKGKTTWGGFVPPCKFKDGDILYIRSGNTWICIYKEGGEKENVYYKYVATSSVTFVHDNSPLCLREHVKEIRLATEEEKQKLFDAIKANGYKWNDESKTLEKLLELNFKVGDIIQDVDNYKVKINEIDTENSYYVYESIIAKGIGSINFSEQNNWKLAPNKFDISTLVPFESKVLVRDGNTEKWKSNFWGFYDSDHAMNHPHECCGNTYRQCIPYNDNTKHLLGTTDDCDEFYKTWK